MISDERLWAQMIVRSPAPRKAAGSFQASHQARRIRAWVVVGSMAFGRGPPILPIGVPHYSDHRAGGYPRARHHSAIPSSPLLTMSRENYVPRTAFHARRRTAAAMGLSLSALVHFCRSAPVTHSTSLKVGHPATGRRRGPVTSPRRTAPRSTRRGSTS